MFSLRDISDAYNPEPAAPLDLEATSLDLSDEVYATACNRWARANRPSGARPATRSEPSKNDDALSLEDERAPDPDQWLDDDTDHRAAPRYDAVFERAIPPGPVELILLDGDEPQPCGVYKNMAAAHAYARKIGCGMFALRAVAMA